jgi:hypothetical protein
MIYHVFERLSNGKYHRTVLDTNDSDCYPTYKELKSDLTRLLSRGAAIYPADAQMQLVTADEEPPV